MLIDERPHGTFTRQLFLGDNLDAGRLDASYDKGVLTLVIPVAEQAKPRRIQITGGNGEPQRVMADTGQSQENQEASR